MRLELVCVRGEERDCWLWSRDQKWVFFQVDVYISQVTVDHGLQQWELWSRSPDCDVVNVTNHLEQWRWQLGSLRDAGTNDSRARLDASEASCSLSPSQIAGHPSSDDGRQGGSGNLGYQYVMRHCIKGSCQVYDHTHCTVRWFPLVEAFLDVCCELEEGRCSRVSGSEALLIFSLWEKFVDRG